MAPIGLAHRPSSHAFVAEWTDLEPESVDDGLRETVERRLRAATEPSPTERASQPEEAPDAPAPGGWFAGEPMS